MLGPCRLVVISLGGLALGLLAWGMARALGPVRAALVFLLARTVPMFGARMHALEPSGLAFTLHLAELGVLLLYFTAPRPRAAVAAPALVALGLALGATARDYLFLGALAPAVLALLLSGPEDRRADALRRCATATACVVLGLAAGLAWNRPLPPGPPSLPFPVDGALGTLLQMLFALAPGKAILDRPLAPIVAVAVAWCGLGSTGSFDAPLGLRVTPARASAAAVGLALAASGAWSLLAPDAARAQAADAARHFFLAYLVGVSALAKTFDLRLAPPA